MNQTIPNTNPLKLLSQKDAYIMQPRSAISSQNDKFNISLLPSQNNLLLKNNPLQDLANNIAPSFTQIFYESDNETSGILRLRPDLEPILQNIVSTVNLGVELNLQNIALKARNAEYNPKRFAAVIMRLREPKTTALIFKSGKMVCTGAKSEDDSKTASRKYARIIQKIGYPDVRFKEFKIQNIVGSSDMKFPIQLALLHMNHNKFATYEPEIFPGLIYRMLNPKIVLLIFVSGKLVLTGAKDKKDINKAFELIYPVLESCRKQTHSLTNVQQ